ncbi:MAG: hypothetical protein H7175_08640 [Burkholderiales bacterium]|nr:hypothetical protein [Anaerolineae bacterium]
MPLLMILFAACVPATEPPQLVFTPGAPIVVTERLYDAGAFSIEYPDGWRVVTGPAEAPPSVVFVAPGDCALIVLSTVPIESPPALAETCGETRGETRRLLAGEVDVYAAGNVAPIEEWESFVPIFEQMVESIRAANETARKR